jgi:exosortase/archaeosortase family protein
VANKNRQSAKSDNDRAAIGIVGRFAAYFVVFDIAIMVAYATGWLNSMLLGTASVSTRIVTWIGIAAVGSGTLIRLPSRTLSVDLACTAVFVVALFVALILAYPVSAKDRLLGIALGVPIILAVNIMRIVAAAQVAESAPTAFQFVHDYMFQVGMVLVTVVVWAAWLSYTRRHAR